MIAGGNTLSTGSRHAEIDVFYFGSHGRSLFGCLQRPARGARDVGVVICYPAGPEYIRSHRALRQLAFRLAKVGLHALRFDHTGCGDSSGEFEDGSLTLWREDISLAVEELRKRTSSRRIVLIGLRLGATLALSAAAERGDVHAITLWNPLIDGRAYLEKLRSWHAQTVGAAAEHDVQAGFTEIIGYPFTNRLIGEITEMKPLPVPGDCRVADSALLVRTGESEDASAVRLALRERGVRLEEFDSPDPELWLLEPYQAVIPHRTLETIVNWVSNACP